MLLSPRKNGLTCLSKEVGVFKVAMGPVQCSWPCGVAENWSTKPGFYEGLVDLSKDCKTQSISLRLLQWLQKFSPDPGNLLNLIQILRHCPLIRWALSIAKIVCSVSRFVARVVGELWTADATGYPRGHEANDSSGAQSEATQAESPRGAFVKTTRYMQNCCRKALNLSRVNSEIAVTNFNDFRTNFGVTDTDFAILSNLSFRVRDDCRYRLSSFRT